MQTLNSFGVLQTDLQSQNATCSASPNVQMPLAFLGDSSETKSQYTNFHQLKAKDIDGNEVNFADFEGKVTS